VNRIRVVSPGYLTTLRLFDPQAAPPPLVRMADRVRFVVEGRP
jgi:allophanate hydrolase subunit 1